MAHIIETEEEKESPSLGKVFRVKGPPITGKFGFSIMLGKKEIFIGIAIADVEIERVVRQRRLPSHKARVKTLILAS